jgi:predicted RND superfamily exporter protein
VTSLVLIAGFLVLTQSGFRVNADMGLLTAITIAFALAADFLFLPPLLMKLDR